MIDNLYLVSDVLTLFQSWMVFVSFALHSTTCENLREKVKVSHQARCIANFMEAFGGNPALERHERKRNAMKSA